MCVEWEHSVCPVDPVHALQQAVGGLIVRCASRGSGGAAAGSRGDSCRPQPRIGAWV